MHVRPIVLLDAVSISFITSPVLCARHVTSVTFAAARSETQLVATAYVDSNVSVTHRLLHCLYLRH